MNEFEEMRTPFKEETEEMLGSLEGLLLELEESGEDAETVAQVFLVLHTIKGNAGMVGFETIAGLMHQVETVFDRIRNGEARVTKRLIDLSLDAIRNVRVLVETDEEPGPSGIAETNRIMAELRKVAESGGEEGGFPASDAGSGGTGVPESVIVRVHFRPSREIFSSGVNPLRLIEEVRSLGASRVIAHTEEIPDLEGLEPGSCHTYWDILLLTDRSTDEIREIFSFVFDDIDLEVDVIAAAGDSVGEQDLDILVEAIQSGTVFDSLDLKDYLELNRGMAGGHAAEEADAIRLADAAADRKAARRKKQGAKSIRVPSDRLDQLVNLVGELVTAQARLTETAGRSVDPEILPIAEDIERLIAELRDNAMTMRMIPIGTIFGSMRLLVRDLSQSLGKEVQLVTEGAETELDKTVIEKIHDPLVHIIRNCIDHGIEPPGVRESRGKPRQGTIRLSAEHAGGEMVIRVRDDGAGLDPASIRRKAVERGLITEDADITDAELFSFILQSGFSTARAVTNVSGRGVGMDVVRKRVEGLRGAIDLSSRPGEGLVVTVRLPLTLAIIEGLVVQVGEELFILPLSHVEECVEMVRRNGDASSRRLLSVRDEIVPYIRLREHFGIGGTVPPIQQAIITVVNGNRVGVVVDNVVGEHRTVIKSLGNLYRDVDDVSGATIMGDGSVVLILDVPKLVQRAEDEEHERDGLKSLRGERRGGTAPGRTITMAHEGGQS